MANPAGNEVPVPIAPTVPLVSMVASHSKVCEIDAPCQEASGFGGLGAETALIEVGDGDAGPFRQGHEFRQVEQGDTGGLGFRVLEEYGYPKVDAQRKNTLRT